MGGRQTSSVYIPIRDTVHVPKESFETYESIHRPQKRTLPKSKLKRGLSRRIKRGKNVGARRNGALRSGGDVERFLADFTKAMAWLPRGERLSFKESIMRFLRSDDEFDYKR